METAYRPELWHDTFVMLGTSSAALFGLLFVVTSLHLDEVMNNRFYRIRARNNSYYLIALVIEAALILMPQPSVAVGAELVVLNLVGLQFHLSNLYKYFYKNVGVHSRGGMSSLRSIAFIISDLLGIAGGACIFASLYWGMYFVAASFLILFVTIAQNAWAIMLGVGQMEKRTKEN